jgi:hypothetical protein
VKAVVELLNCPISSVEVPGLVIVTFCDAALPTFTSPKSTADGLRSIAPALDPADEALGFPPQPESPRLIARPTTAINAESEMSF